MINVFNDRNGTPLMEIDYFSLEQEAGFIGAVTGVHFISFGNSDCLAPRQGAGSELVRRNNIVFGDGESHDNPETARSSDENTKDKQRKNKFQFTIYSWSEQSFPSNTDVGQHGSSCNVQAYVMHVRDRAIRMTLYKKGTSQNSFNLTALKYPLLCKIAIIGDV